jgi:hypothetical protein
MLSAYYSHRKANIGGDIIVSLSRSRIACLLSKHPPHNTYLGDLSVRKTAFIGDCVAMLWYLIDGKCMLCLPSRIAHVVKPGHDKTVAQIRGVEGVFIVDELAIQHGVEGGIIYTAIG